MRASMTEPATVWPVLHSHELRVLGVLVEKAKTTPDVYPLSMNSLVTGCNQKSNRDPILNLTDLDVEEALLAAQKRALVTRITGGRVERWRHGLYEAWNVGKVELAILAELLLRGPQTEGELRARASRMEAIADLDALRAALGPLAERRLIVYLTPEGRRGTVLTHGFHSAQELDRLRNRHQGPEEAAEETTEDRSGVPGQLSAGTARTGLVDGLEEARAEIAALRSMVTDLQGDVRTLTEQLRQVREGLGL
jgi:uncharacterized protein YceH (UPF0502 family)